MSLKKPLQKSVWHRRRRSTPALLVFFLCAMLLGIFMLSRAQVDVAGLTDKPEVLHLSATPNMKRLFDGMPSAAASTFRFAVVIDNLAEARPQAGVNDAGLVIEAPAEAGITRWLAFFEFGDCQNIEILACRTIEKIGPVRSLRPYFLDLAEGYRTPVAHVGGSPEALDHAQKSHLFTMNEFSFGRYFFRDPARQDPHRVFTSTLLLEKALSDVGVAFQDLVMPWTWQRKTSNLKSQILNPRSFRFVNYPPPPEKELAWTYNPQTSLFERRAGGALQRDTQGTVIAAKNVFIVETSVLVTDAVGRRRITTTGTGTAWRLTATGRERLIWKRAAQSPFSFTRANGQPLELDPGKVWIVIVPAGQEVIEHEGLGVSE